MEEKNKPSRTLEEISLITGVGIEELNDLASSISNHVKIKRIPKKNGGNRILYIPSDRLKTVLKKINRNILQSIPLPNQAHGSIPGKSPITNAKQHIGKPYILKLDIENFYPSIRFIKVKNLFIELGFSNKCATLMTRLTTFKGTLGQGFPTSSTIANLILAQNVIPRIVGLCKKMNLTFTIYQDDITISGMNRMRNITPAIKKILNQNGFFINTNKYDFMNSQSQQKVTGYVVNTKVNIPKFEYRLLRSLIHNCRILGIEIVADRPIDSFILHIKGRIQRVKEVNPARGKRLEDEFNLSINK